MASLSLSFEVDSATADLLSDALLEAGAESVIVDSPDRKRSTLTALFAEHDEPARALGRALERCGGSAALAFTMERVEDQDWVRRSQAQFSPLALERLWIGASWHSAPAHAPIVVRIDPGLAFGTGSHASTRLVLGFIERAVRGGESVLDYGCGSGILAVAAAKLGAATVDAVDIDPKAVEVSRANARANGVNVRTFLPPELPPGHYQVVVANILAQPLIELAPALSARTVSGGQIALAGVLDAQAAEVAAAYEPFFEMMVDAHDEGWALLRGGRR